MIHSEDNTKVETKITSDGELFIFCPECRRVWQTSVKVIKEPMEKREFKYDGAKLDLDLVRTETTRAASTPEMSALAREIFPEAYK